MERFAFFFERESGWAVVGFGAPSSWLCVVRSCVARVVFLGGFSTARNPNFCLMGDLFTDNLSLTKMGL